VKLNSAAVSPKNGYPVYGLGSLEKLPENLSRLKKLYLITIYNFIQMKRSKHSLYA
jgi:hypothetical protein